MNKLEFLDLCRHLIDEDPESNYADESFICTKCAEECDVYQEIEIDHEPYGDRMVERRSFFTVSMCCNQPVESLDQIARQIRETGGLH